MQLFLYLLSRRWKVHDTIKITINKYKQICNIEQQFSFVKYLAAAVTHLNVRKAIQNMLACNFYCSIQKHCQNSLLATELDAVNLQIFARRRECVCAVEINAF